MHIYYYSDSYTTKCTKQIDIKLKETVLGTQNYSREKDLNIFIDLFTTTNVTNQ